VKEWCSGLGINAHSWFTVFLLGEIAITTRHEQLWLDVTCMVYCAPITGSSVHG